MDLWSLSLFKMDSDLFSGEIGSDLLSMADFKVLIWDTVVDGILLIFFSVEVDNDDGDDDVGTVVSLAIIFCFENEFLAFSLDELGVWLKAWISFEMSLSLFLTEPFNSFTFGLISFLIVDSTKKKKNFFYFININFK